MRHVVKVTSQGRTTIPKEFRKKYDIQEGDSLLFEARGKKIVVYRIKKLEDLGGIDSQSGTSLQLKVEAGELRKEYR